MDDLISRQDAIEALYEAFCYAYCDNCEKEMNEDLCGDCHRKYQNWSASKKTIEKVINNLPSAQRKTGRWLYKSGLGWGETWICSECGEKTTSTVMGKPRYLWCPMCGSEMKGEQDVNTEP